MILHSKKNSIHDEYFVTDQVLGKGEAAKRPVVLCINKKTNIKYALKVLEDNRDSRREISTHWAACLNTDYVVKIVDLFECSRSRKKYLLLVLEYMEGGELFNHFIKQNIPFSEQQVAKYMYHICSALNNLHEKQLAHRNLKLENLLLSDNDESKAFVKITDFSFAKGENPDTDEYATNETQSIKYDQACDVWSLGVILFILCFGFAPFQNSDSLDMNQSCSSVSQQAKNLICAMLNKVPEKRIKIKDIMSDPWISNWSSVKETKLSSMVVLKSHEENWSKVQEEYGIALENMRIVHDISRIQIKA